ncbi:guanylate kinase [Echinimonas agarilytica]|uniref:Guanylate kinase n=1 Tax=Echinimonas agarilytica TaxID=1215918 RepID=A0AA41W9B7_9GAMM|nr:guanylate kinase [Echinimonas agarilytica]MCM2681002.1 guanylate kinase [Echinimonas agarilytica]
MTANRGSLIIVSAPSGAGKSSLISALIEALGTNRVQVSVSHTTRAPRPGEIDGQHYHFVSHQEFHALIEQGVFFEYAEVFGHYYGTSCQAIEQQLNNGIDVMLDIDWQGAQQIRKQVNDSVSVFILPPSSAELESRLRNRGQDSDEIIAGRMAKAQAEMSHFNEYDYIIVNDNFEHALADMRNVVASARLRLAGQLQRHKVMLNELLAEGV